MRARDVHMAAAVDAKRRWILMTGAIDQKEQNILVNLSVPEPGIWTIFKAEVNQTDDAWVAWQITFGGGMRIPKRKTQRYATSRQFKKTKYLDDRNAVIFFDGEVRPGDAVLKVFAVEFIGKKGVVAFGNESHSRLSGAVSVKDVKAAIRSGFGEEDPVIEVTLPTRRIRQ